MNFQQAIASLGRPKTLREAIAAIRGEHGEQAAAAAEQEAAAAAAAVPTTVDQALAAIRAEHGAGATRWVQARFGISLRQAQRYMRGEGLTVRTAAGRARRAQLVDAAAEPAQARARQVQAAIMRRASRRWVAAGVLRRATSVNVGRVRVHDVSKRRPGGSRDVGYHRVGDTLRAGELADVAALLEAGDEEGALQAFSDALLDAYAARNGDPRGSVSEALTIEDYPTGIQVETG